VFFHKCRKNLFVKEEIIVKDHLQQLQKKLLTISRKIHALQALVELSHDAQEEVKIRKEIKRLQWQALFYLERIENLKAQEGDHG
jgi:hypothetical protein